MTIYYRGAGLGTYWHTNNAMQEGFTPQSPQLNHTPSLLINHIARGTVTSPYISLTQSYGVAWDYAVTFSRARPTQQNPAYVYQVEINDPPPKGPHLLDPVKEIAASAPSPPAAIPYHHDGLPSFLLGVVSSSTMRLHLNRPIKQPPGGGTLRSANLTLELEAIVRALRDAELLVVGDIPDSCVQHRYPEW